MIEDPVLGFEFVSDPARIDRDLVFGFLSETYWAGGIPREVFDAALDGSMLFGMFERATGAQVAFARLVTDRATFAWMADVFVVETHQGCGLGQALVDAIVALPWLEGVRRILIATADAHQIYDRAGFSPLTYPARFMEKLDRRHYAGPE